MPLGPNPFYYSFLGKMKLTHKTQILGFIIYMTYLLVVGELLTVINYVILPGRFHIADGPP